MRQLRSLLPMLVVLFLFVTGCGDRTERATEQTSSSAVDGTYLTVWNNALSSVMVNDIVSPPVASRNYAYPNIAAYEVLAHLDPGFRSLEGQLRGLEETPEPEGIVDPELASIVAFSRMAQALVFDGSPLAEREASVLEDARRTLSGDLVNASVRYGEAMAAAIKAYANADNYAQTRTMSRYVLNTEDPSRWYPTPPDYQEALEPNWNQLRPFILTSLEEYVPDPPTPFDSSQGSAFFEEMMEVYRTVSVDTPERIEIAKFWDCNPLVSTHIGHLMTFEKKITPGGHWIGITGIAARSEGLDAMRTAEAYAMTAVALADGFIVAWDEKYRSVLIRPVTVINRYIDPDWRPLLQTPPFPEYTSAHSVVSGAASTVLTALFGEPFSFVDSTEVEFGLPARSFDSFREAASEAAISRMYGGIHYRPAIEIGVQQGRAVGQSVVDRIQTREPEDLAVRR
ncbi:MAG: vanadium-dependent haloperoxidase [Bacteroidetes bacterium]|nr:vanadium-dependent haloperoxidase [Bacteroidota bacterium]